METPSSDTSINSMMNLGRVGESKPYPRTPTALGSADKKWDEQIAAGNIPGTVINERASLDSLRPRAATDATAALNELKNTMDGFIQAGKNTLARLDDRLEPGKLERMGFGRGRDGKGRDWAEPLSDDRTGMLEQIRMISEVLWQDENYQDESIRSALHKQIIDNPNPLLSFSDRTELKRIVDGFHHIRNMSLNYTAAAGDTAIWTLTESKNGKVSDAEVDRISFQHLYDQIQIYPQLSVLMEELDDAVIRNISNKDFDINDFFESTNYGTSLVPSLSGEQIWKRQYLCDLALNWYRIIGFPDIRKFGNRTKEYKAKMPSLPILSAYIKPDNPGYVKALKHDNCSIGLTPFYFLMDPLSLQGEILKKDKEVIATTRTYINRNRKTDHSIPNLGWRPAAWDFIDHVLAVDAVAPEDINNKSLKELGFSKLNHRKWNDFLNDPDLPGKNLLQMQNIKFAEKAMNTRSLYWNCLSPLGLSIDNIGKLFDGVADLIRTEKSDTIFNREKIMPLVMDTLIIVGHETGRARLKLNMKSDELDYFLKLLKMRYQPTQVFSNDQISLLKSYCK